MNTAISLVKKDDPGFQSMVIYDAACRAIAEANRIDEVKDINDKAYAMQLYAKQAENRELEIQASKIRIRARHRFGEISSGLDKAQGARRDLELIDNDVHKLSKKEILEKAGVTQRTAARYEKIAEIPIEELDQIIESATLPLTVEHVTKAAAKNQKQVKRSQERAVVQQETCTLKDLNILVNKGVKYGCIYADPPWRYGNQGTRAATGNHYEGMSIEELCEMPISDIAAEQSHLHLWTTNGFLEDSFKVLRAWGFEYKSCFVWVKPQMGIGNYWRVSHEFMLLGVRGGITFEDRGLMSWFNGRRNKHSAKPEEVRGMITKASPGPYLELFGRRYVEGWTIWGNEIDRDLFYREAI